MKKFTIYGFWLSAIFCMLASCSNAQEPATGKGELLTGREILIVYLSRTNNTKAVAEIIHNNVGGDMADLELVTPSPELYKTPVDNVAEKHETGNRPPLKT